MPTLQWLSREKDLRAAGRAPYRLLEEAERHGDASARNMLIQGDNLEALKALLPYYAGKVKCIYIDPPYNTRSAFAHYDDNLEHTRWLSMMYPRLELLREFLGEEGSIWVSCDDNEGHYLKVIMDEVFGRKNFIDTVIWQKIYTIKNSAKYFSGMHDYIFIYSKNKDLFHVNLILRDEKSNKRYSNPDNDPRGPWITNAVQARNFYSMGLYEITGPTGKTFTPPKGTFWRVSEKTFYELDKDKRIWWGEDGTSVPRVKRFLSEVKQGIVPTTFWSHLDVGQNADAKQEVRELFKEGGDIFATPKPERLLRRILHIATNPGDLVLDSFLGSGTTAAVAHKMGRRYIGIEMGEHARTHCLPRLCKVIDGEAGGISAEVDWTGGGGFRFCTLGESIFDEDGAIRAGLPFARLAAHVWFCETGEPLADEAASPLLGVHEGTAYYLLYNGILGDKRPRGGNVLTRRVLAELPAHDGPKVVYGERCLLSPRRLKELDMVFRQTPYDIKGR